VWIRSRHRLLSAQLSDALGLHAYTSEWTPARMFFHTLVAQRYCEQYGQDAADAYIDIATLPDSGVDGPPDQGSSL
jgi:hypothetical protein